MNETYYRLNSEDINSTVCFILNNNRVTFRKFALVDEESNFLASFNSKDQAKRFQNNSMYVNSTLINLAMPDDIIIACLDTRLFNTSDEVIEYINGGYKECAEYKVAHIEKELNSENVNTDMLTLDEYKSYKQELNKKALAEYLENHPIQWTDGKYYGVTQEDQIEMQSDLTAYNLKRQTGDDLWKLEWHDKQKACREFTVEEFYGLINAIIDFVYPLRRLQEEFKEEIYACETKEELDAMVIDYTSVPASDSVTVETGNSETTKETT